LRALHAGDMLRKYVGHVGGTLEFGIEITLLSTYKDSFCRSRNYF